MLAQTKKKKNCYISVEILSQKTLKSLENKKIAAAMFGWKQRGTGNSSRFSTASLHVWHEKMPQASQRYSQALKSIVWKQLLMTIVDSLLHFLQNMFVFFPIYSKHLKASAFMFLLYVCIRMQMYSLLVKTKMLNAYACIDFHGYGEELEICIGS